MVFSVKLLADMISCSYYYTEKKGKRQIRTNVLVSYKSINYNIEKIFWTTEVVQIHIQQENER